MRSMHLFKSLRIQIHFNFHNHLQLELKESTINNNKECINIVLLKNSKDNKTIGVIDVDMIPILIAT